METSIIKSSINYRCKLKEVLRVLDHLVFLHVSIIINLIKQLSIKINLMNSKKRYFFNRYYLVCTKVGLCTKVSFSSLIPTLKLYTYLRFVIPFCQNENKVQIILFTTSYKLPLVFFSL